MFRRGQVGEALSGYAEASSMCVLPVGSQFRCNPTCVSHGIVVLVRCVCACRPPHLRRWKQTVRNQCMQKNVHTVGNSNPSLFGRAFRYVFCGSKCTYLAQNARVTATRSAIVCVLPVMLGCSRHEGRALGAVLAPSWRHLGVCLACHCALVQVQC